MLQWFVLQRAAIELLWAIGDVNSVDEGHKTLKPILRRMYERNRQGREDFWRALDYQAVVYDDAIVFGRRHEADALLVWERSPRLRKVLE